MTKAIPDGYHTLTPYLALRDAAKAIEFYKAALGATELYRLSMPGGKIAHGEMQVGTSRLMFSDAMPEWGNKSARDYGGTPVGLCIYTENVEALAERFMKAGGRVVTGPPGRAARRRGPAPQGVGKAARRARGPPECPR